MTTSADVRNAIAILSSSVMSLNGNAIDEYKDTLSEFLTYLRKSGVSGFASATASDALGFLEMKSRKESQRMLDKQRIQILAILHLLGVLGARETIPRVRSKRLGRRVMKNEYTSDSIERLIQRMSFEDRLVTLLSYRCGIRISEVYSLRQGTAESGSSSEEQVLAWSGRKGVEYAVMNTKGVERTVLIPNALAKDLEKCRYLTDKKIVINDTVRSVYYCLPSSSDFSVRFQALSNEVLGWATNVYGLRHAFARDRKQELSTVLKKDQVNQVIALEMGCLQGDTACNYWI